MNNNQFDTIIFDLDGTVLHTLPDLVVITNTALADFGFPPRSASEIRSFIGAGAHNLVHLALPDGTPKATEEAFWAHWPEVSDKVNDYLAEPFSGMPELLADLHQRGFHLGILTNKRDVAAQKVIAHHYPGIFEAVHGFNPDAGFPLKPSPEGLLRELDELTATPERTLYVGDGDGDIQTGRAAGCATAAVLWGYRDEDLLRAQQPDMVFATPDDLHTFLCYDDSSQ